MSEPVGAVAPPDLQLSDLDLTFERGDTRHPLRLLVQGLRLRLSKRGLERLAQGLVDEADRRAPVGLRLLGLRVGDDGIHLFLRVEKGIFGSDLSTRLSLSAPEGQELRVELTDTDLPAWLPLDTLLDEAVKRSGAAARRDPEHRRALLLDPAALLARGGLPGRFAPGRWSVTTSGDGVDLRFREANAAG